MKVRGRNLLLPNACVTVAIALLSVRAAGAADDLLPDMIVDGNVLGEIRIDVTTLPGRRLLRLSAMTPNIGRGRMEVRADLTGVTDPTQPSPVLQRIYRSDGTFWDRSAGSETFDPEHGHVHFDDWAQYRLRVVNDDGSPGAVVAQSNKTSFCLFDLVPYDLSNPFIEIPSRYASCGYLVQGITPGWADEYDLEVPDQWIDISGIADGAYWLEAEVDPDDRVLEADETNNTARVRIQTGAAPAAQPDAYEENDSIEEVDADQRPVGVPGSPNLGSVVTRRELGGLSMDDASDFFKFRLEATAQGGSVRIESAYLGSDLDLAVLDAQGNVVGASTTAGNFERVSIDGAAAGDYYAWVIGSAGANPAYRLVIDPGGNQAPHIAITSPAEAGIYVELNFETAPVSWTATDPEGRATVVSLAIDHDQTIDKGTLRLPAYQTLNGAAGRANINTEGLGLGRWFLYAEVTDGNGVGTAWSPGALYIYIKGDVNFDGVVDGKDWQTVRRGWERGKLGPGWDHILDMNRDGVLAKDDIAALQRLVFGRDASCEGGR